MTRMVKHARELTQGDRMILGSLSAAGALGALDMTNRWLHPQIHRWAAEQLRNVPPGSPQPWLPSLAMRLRRTMRAGAGDLRAATIGLAGAAGAGALYKLLYER